MIQCKINNISVKVEKGTTIIQAFKKIEQDIAHYCYHPGLSIAGVCRLCMVHIEGVPKLQIACNTLVQEGMVITNQSKEVKETVKWGLEFHLINHPLDCPICDQAGECALQEQYMKFGQYDPLMAENKVKKRKVVDLGSKIVLDTERCILCTRCTRFTDEISKTKELGIFNRGNHSEIGIFKDKPLENNYALNTVDICPVGALTSKKFRFKQRVWYLKKAPSVCTGCSTGCNTYVYYNEEGLWRILPRYNKDINQHWMCDYGKDTYQHENKKDRLFSSFFINHKISKKIKTTKALGLLKEELSKKEKTLALVVTGQYTTEEYSDFFSFYKNTLHQTKLYHWKNHPDSFDSFDHFLIRGDKNPNTYGLLQTAKNQGLVFNDWKYLENQCKNLDMLLVLAPQNPSLFPCLEEKINLFMKAPYVVWIAPHSHPLLQKAEQSVLIIPAKTDFEKTGTFANHKGVCQKIKAIGSIVPEAYSLQEMVQVLTAGEFQKTPLKPLASKMKTNYLLDTKGSL